MADRSGAVTARLSLATLKTAGPQVLQPAVDPRELQIGLVHLGIGAFHRAHQAVFTELAAAATGSTDWGIAASTQRSATVRDQLVPQDGLYSVLSRGAHEQSLRIIGSVREVIDGAREPQDVVARIADPDVRVVTLTVTEKGYRRDAGGGLDRADPLTAADLAGGDPRTAIGQLVRGLQQRGIRDAGPITLLACDNLVGNGQVLSRLVHEFVSQLPSGQRRDLESWMPTAVSFPSCMVDRIVPATTPADHADVLDRLGLEDQGAVVAEPFTQWVIEDDFAAARPAWERAGAVFTTDVGPWETAKLRLLNGTHSTLAYLGALRGHRTIAEAMGDPELATVARSLMREDVIPTLTPPDELDLEQYAAEILDRFLNPVLRHTTAQVAMDGSQKLPLRLLGPIRDRLAAGSVPHWATLAVAGWMTYVSAGRDRPELVLNDPLAAELTAATASATTPAAIVDALLAVRSIFGDDLPDHAAWRAELVAAVKSLS